MMDKYDASNHPDVVSGKKTKTAVLREFLETFEVGGEIDGKVTKEEFINTTVTYPHLLIMMTISNS